MLMTSCIEPFIFALAIKFTSMEILVKKITRMYHFIFSKITKTEYKMNERKFILLLLESNN